jgi:hypothetical protein
MGKCAVGWCFKVGVNGSLFCNLLMFSCIVLLGAVNRRYERKKSRITAGFFG